MNPMKVNSFECYNVNVAYAELWPKLAVFAEREKSRAGDVMVFPGPYLTTYDYPRERVLFDPDRDCNPVFHLMEAIWMLAGRNDVDFLLPFNARYVDYAEPNGVVHGAYGHRWIEAFGQNQITTIVEILRRDRNSRQAVLQMWDCDLDLGQDDKRDRPCNTHAYFDLRGGVLNMTVCCRSNDMVWGAYGANVVHFSMLQEVIAHALGVHMGKYTQMSNNAHVYVDVPIVQKHMKNHPTRYDYYADNTVVPMQMLHEGEDYEFFLDECDYFCHNSSYKPENHFLQMARRLQIAYMERKGGNPGWPAELGDLSLRNDWVRAFNEWAARRANVQGK